MYRVSVKRLSEKSSEKVLDKVRLIRYKNVARGYREKSSPLTSSSFTIGAALYRRVVYMTWHK